MENLTTVKRQDVVVPPFQPDLSQLALSALIWIELVACFFFVTLRTWVQYRNSKRLFSNDWLIFAAIVCHAGAVAVCQLAIPYMYDIERLKLVLEAGGTPSTQMVASAQTFLQFQFALLLLLWTTLWLVKFSLLIFFWRLFESVHTKVRIFWYIMLAVTASTYIVTIFVQLFACGSPQNFFKLSGCADSYHMYLSNLVFLFSAGSDIAGDVLILLIPFPLLWKLRTTRQQKVILVIIFLLPLVPIIFGVLRLVLCNPVTGVVNVIRFQLYSLLENTAAIITACLPSLRLFVTSSRNNSRATGTVYYNGGSGLSRSAKSRGHDQSGPVRLGSSATEQDGTPFDTRAFSRVESEEEAGICGKGMMMTSLTGREASDVSDPAVDLKHT
ncbi:uncharacterized protein HMPREF1541_02446 [Cyphellophora europaea CBS 101466]|uniref:Rhodopsin domain-containing protein n=1 Tax=Cyphellophora europaea (strain CBS 101466) TaxID=1220924 RepID=W2S3M7_CYPE1|nr:uncharacterized protein HMPREF1541_02446 [Cyphellophora europaea CBS 101466]ETN43287.1 hypothetical protein HMPREF1541_02446 [Cyphellophora europaea CBS 101466]